jgi:hypothetical protein
MEPAQRAAVRAVRLRCYKIVGVFVAQLYELLKCACINIFHSLFTPEGFGETSQILLRAIRNTADCPSPSKR